MRPAAWLMVLAVGALAACGGRAADDAKGVEVDLDGLKATTPADWKKEEPDEKLRAFRWMQFGIPKAKDDKNDAELTIFKGSNIGGAEANIARWRGLFKPQDGKTLNDSSKVEEITIGGMKAAYLDVSGTYTAPFSKEGPRPDYRLLAVYFDGKDNTYTFKLVGPAATVEAAKKGFDEWLKAFK